MPSCRWCHQDGLEWYIDQFGRSRLGTKIDINTYREHKCLGHEEAPNKIQISHDYCFQCELPIRLDAPCEHMRPKAKENKVEDKIVKGTLLEFSDSQ